MSAWKRGAFAGLSCSLLLVACGGGDTDGPADAGFGGAGQRASHLGTELDSALDEGLPIISRLTIEPREPVSRTRVRADLEVDGAWESMEYVWDLNGEVFGANSAEVTLPIISTGDTISVRVVPTSRGGVVSEPKTATLIVRNQAPLLTGLSIDFVPEGSEWSGEGEIWRARVDVEDPDGDDVDLEFEWFVNGVRSDTTGEFFPADQLTRGDRLEVKVRAYDGRRWSGAARSGSIEVGNMPPQIVSVPPLPEADGRFYYAVEVEDADGDHNFRFALEQAPTGMEIDSVDGIVTWTPGISQTGRHPVELVVTDESGAEARQSFSLALTRRSDSGRSYPAAKR